MTLELGSRTALREPSPPPAPGVHSFQPRQRAWPYLLPLIVLTAVWVYGPIVFTIALSMLDWNLIDADPEFVGARNYTDLVSQPQFARDALNTGLYILALLPFATVIPMGLAIMLWKYQGRTRNIYRNMLFVPVILVPVATALSWQFLLDPLQGLINHMLATVGLPQPNWLLTSTGAFFVIIMATAGKVIGLNFLLYTARLHSINRQLVDASRVDGAREWEVTRHILVPHLSRTTMLLALLCVTHAGIWLFTNVAFLTQGGPGGATSNLYYLLYQYGFNFSNAGGASAIAVFLLVGVGAVVGIIWMLGRRGEAT